MERGFSATYEWKLWILLQVGEICYSIILFHLLVRNALLADDKNPKGSLE